MPEVLLHDISLGCSRLVRYLASQVVIQKASSDVYAASIDNKIAMKVGPGDWSPEMVNLQMGQKEWKLLCSGPKFAVWEAVH